MKIEAFLLCDAATDSQGKLNVLGAFDGIFAQKVPVTHRSCSIALRIRFSKIEEGQHKIKITMIDADGKNVVPPLNGDISVAIPDDVSSKPVNMVLNIHNIKFSDFGEYRFDLAINGREEASLPFHLRRMPDNVE